MVAIVDVENSLLDLPIAVSPCYEGNYASIIYTHEGIQHSICKVADLVDCYCMNYGSNLKGRLSATRMILGFKKNPPILISQTGIVGIQVPTPQRRGITWILSLNFEIKSCSKNECIIIIENSLELTVCLSKKALRAKKAQAMEVLIAFTKKD